jgi:hypothetical protein
VCNRHVGAADVPPCRRRQRRRSLDLPLRYMLTDKGTTALRMQYVDFAAEVSGIELRRCKHVACMFDVDGSGL